SLNSFLYKRDYRALQKKQVDVKGKLQQLVDKYKKDASSTSNKTTTQKTNKKSAKPTGESVVGAAQSA
ncbi:unnamed protein product, partial [Amoebophrya sp. A25]